MGASMPGTRPHSTTAAPLIAALSISVGCSTGVLRGPTGLDRVVRPFQRRRRVRQRRLGFGARCDASLVEGLGRPPCRWGGCQRDAGGGDGTTFGCRHRPAAPDRRECLVLPPHSLPGRPRTAESWIPADAHAPPVCSAAPFPLRALLWAMESVIAHELSLSRMSYTHEIER